MLMNNLDPDVAERPEDLVVYGGTGRAARSWEAFDAIVRALRALEDDETLLVQSGKPVGVMRTHEWAPRVLIANSNLVPEWATWDEFRRLEDLGLTMYGQMTAGSWIYIGTQGILQGTYECFAEIARRRYGGSLAGTITLTAGLGGMGGAQPLAVTMNGGVALCVEVDPRAHPAAAGDALPRRAGRRPRRRGRALPGSAKAERRALSRRAAAATPPRCCRGCSRRGFEADIVTDQTSAHDPLGGYVPDRLVRGGGRPLRARRPGRVRPPLARRDGRPLRGDGRLPGPRRRGVRLRQLAARGGEARRLRARVRLPRLRARLRAAAVLRGQGPVPLGRAVGRPGRHRRDRPRRRSRSSPTTSAWRAGSSAAGERIAFQGLPARICWLGYGERHRLGLRFNEMVRVRRAERADRDRARPPRLRLGRLALPRDGGDGRRVRRDRRLAAAERAGQHVVGRVVGVDPPRRRRRHRPLDPRRAWCASPTAPSWRPRSSSAC